MYNRKPAVIITVEKEWDPAPPDGTTVTVELHRYAKITKGSISVTLYDNNEAPIEGAVFVLYKDGTATETEVATNVNGIAIVSGLEAGTYKLVQISTPSGYSMEGHTTETRTLTVVGEATTSQTLNEQLTNTALLTAGKATLTATDSGAGSGTAGAPISGATFTLYKDGAVYNTGYTSDAEGRVVVGNLAAGEYYFVQTGTAADYNLPNVTRTENFTVLEQPGVSQIFTQSMTNSLKGKGTVSLMLIKEDGSAISAATFQLKSGNTVLDTATTGTDGTLSFSTELYEGTYTVHQVNTGSAGDDYATAVDQNVTIEANSVTTQQKSLSFVNEEASGNVTITMYKGDYSQHNQAVITPSITGLKAGIEYTFRIGEMPTNNVDNGDTIGYTTSFVPGKAPGNVTAIPKSSWIRSGNTYYYDIKYTPQQNDTTYVFGIVSLWGLKDAGITFTLVDGSSLLASPLSYATSPRSARLFSTSALRTTVTAQHVTHTNASPAAAPEGYATDTTFVESYTLTAEDNWKHTFDIQDKYDADGNPYYYYIVETACSDGDYWIDSYTGGTDGLLNDVGTLKVKNIKEKNGSIQVKKSFSGVNALPEGFQITNSYNEDVVFTVDNASGSGTEADPYVWTIPDIPDGTTVSFTESGATVNGYSLTVTSSGIVVADLTVSATAEAGKTVEASLVNTYVPITTDVTIKKVDKDDLSDANPVLLKGAAFTLSKYESDSYQSKDLEWGTQGSETLSDDKKPDGTYTLNGIFSFEGLSVGYYKIEEINFPDGYVKISSNPTFMIEANESNELTITLIDNPNSLLQLVNGEMTIKFGNTPGVALPQTGGSGIGLFTLIGGILSATAGAILTLTSHRRRKEQYT